MEIIKGMNELIARSLRLEEPWYIVGAGFEESFGDLFVTVEVRKKAALPCPHCGGATSRYGYEPKLRMWRHGDCLFHPCLVGCQRPRVICPDCGVTVVHAPFEHGHSRFTLLFEGFAMMLMQDMPIARAARVMRCNEKSLTKILRYWVEKAVDAQDFSGLRYLGLDETSFKRGHDYVTVVVDAEARRVVGVEKGRDKKAVEAFAVKLLEQGGHRDNIEIVTSDMSKSYMPAIAEQFPNAVNVLDKFHVKKALVDALDKVRIEEQKEQGKAKKKSFSKAAVCS